MKGKNFSKKLRGAQIDHPSLAVLRLNKHTSNSCKECVLIVHFENLKELRDIHNDCVLVPDKIQIKRDIWRNYQKRFTNKD